MPIISFSDFQQQENADDDLQQVKRRAIKHQTKQTQQAVAMLGR
jgi:hypothetical protein